MNPHRRRAALRVGGAVISASLLLLVERCGREAEPARRAGLDGAQAPAVTADRAKPAPQPAPGLRPPLAPRPTTGAPRRWTGPPADSSLRGLVVGRPRRSATLVAANDALQPPALPAPDVQPPPVPSPGAEPGAPEPGAVARPATRTDRIAALALPPLAPDGPPTAPAAASEPDPPLAAAPAPSAPPRPAAAAEVPSLQGLAGVVQPREPLLGLADAEHRAAPAEPPPPSPLTLPAAAPPANDNAPLPRPAAEPPASGPTPSPAHPDAAATLPPAPLAAAQSDPVAPPAPAAPAPPATAAATTPAAPMPEPTAAVAANTPAAPAATAPITAVPVAGTPVPRGGDGLVRAAEPVAGFADDDELILEIATARNELTGTIIAYTQGGIPYLPLGEIARFLDLAVTVSDGGRYATGWAIDPTRTITLNLREGTVTIDGQTRKLAPGDAVAFDGELYLRAERFGDLFPLTLTPNLRSQTVTVQTRVPFPFEQRLARETAREQLRGRLQRRDGRGFPKVATPWRALDLPLLDSEWRLASDTTRGTRSEADLRLAGDFAWLTARAFVSGDSQNGLTAARLELGRRDPDGGLLGPLGATAFGLGDVTSTPLAMGPASVAGRGLFLGNAPLERASVFDRIELRGDMPDGFEAELYRNNILIDSASGPDNGQYRFLNVPVEFGLNVFRVVLYGPQGQRRETVRQISVGDGRIGAGELVYAASAVQKNRTLFNLQGRDYQPGADDGSLRATAEAQYGLSGGLTGALGAAWYERFGARHWLATGGLRSGFAGFAVKLDLGLSDGAGRALGLGLARKLGGFSVTLNHAEYGGRFVDEVRAFSDQPLRRATELAFNGALRLGAAGLSLPTNGLVRNLAFADGRRVLTGSLNQTLPLSRGLQLSNLLEFNRTSQPLFGTTTQLRGAFDLASLARRSTQLRASLGYELTPRSRIASAAVQVDRRIGPDTTLTATAAHMFEAGQDRFGLSAIHRFPRFAVALDGAYSTRPAQYTAMLRVSFSLGRNPLDGRLFMSQTGLASGGAIALHAFRDLDGDGRFSPGEPPLGDVRFFAGSENQATDAAGHVLLGKLGDGARTSVRIDADSLPDINLAPVSEGIELSPRPGRIHVESFPVRALGELDGTAYFRTAEGERGVSGVIVLLLDPGGRPAARTRTGSDGSFWFEKVVPGPYRLALDPGQAERLKIQLVGEPAVTIGRDGAGQRLDLHLQAREPTGTP
ncbi:hypothetical protein ACFOON_11460 [Novosphingobium piscinae]|uniref:Carboxypeptidase regulatory-like domain-containing protein n=1 Tax=Novosphingobium piscinae TaxID=1507448 RepID=A0A7X1FWB1_9SPHN|nr:hypothetical protein [Novosphingobium piscinae]MBC2668166.1 hypothetical protein [Novosphingobium piscinae]